MQRYLALSLALLGCIACNKSTGEGGSPTASTSSPHEGARDTPRLRPLGPAVMLRHEILSVAVRDAVVRGDLDAARRNAKELGAVTVGGTPEIVEHAKEMNAVAARIAAAPDLAAAARGTGALAKTCADCHARLTGPTKLAAEPAPRAAGREARMQRHAWAVGELWDGLVDNSEDPWRKGSAALADPTLPATELVPPKRSSPEVEAQAKGLKQLGERAQATTDTALRSEAYGDILATCATCHARVR